MRKNTDKQKVRPGRPADERITKMSTALKFRPVVDRRPFATFAQLSNSRIKELSPRAVGFTFLGGMRRHVTCAGLGRLSRQAGAEAVPTLEI